MLKGNKLRENKGFTLVELLVTLAITAILFAFLVNIFVTIFGVNNDTSDLSISQIKAHEAMDTITSQVKYASSFDIVANLPGTLSQDTYYMASQSGVVLTKKSGASDVILSPDGTSSQFTYQISFTKTNSKVVEISLDVIKDNSVLFNTKSKVYINNLIVNSITGVATGDCIAYKVSVTGVVNVPVTSITVTSSSSTINVKGQTLQMGVTVLPSNATNKSVSWTIDNTTLATIDQNGLLTPLKNGTVTVTATALDGSGVLGTKAIVITNQDIKITSITLASSTGSTSLKKGGRTLTVIPTITPSNATNQTITWSVNNTTYATINSSGILTSGSSSGKTVVVTATSNDGSGKNATISISITN
jgi:prepilin-type N-terminal cleavage/methylation domain-containing protein